jgi:hypothetical protein
MANLVLNHQMVIESNHDQDRLGYKFDGQDWFWLPSLTLYLFLSPYDNWKDFGFFHMNPTIHAGGLFMRAHISSTPFLAWVLWLGCSL